MKFITYVYKLLFGGKVCVSHFSSQVFELVHCWKSWLTKKKVSEKLSPINITCVVSVNVAHHSLDYLHVDRFPTFWKSINITTKVLWIVYFVHQDLTKCSVREMSCIRPRFVTHVIFFNSTKFSIHRIELWDWESIFTSILHSFKLGWNGSVKITNWLINCEIHKLDAKFILNFCLWFNAIFNNNGHFFNRIHFGFLSDVNPII